MRVVVAQLRRVEAKEAAGEALSEDSLLGLNKQGRVDGERGCGGHDRLFDGLCLLAMAGLGTFKKRRDEEDFEVQDLQVPEVEELVLGRDGR